MKYLILLCLVVLSFSLMKEDPEGSDVLKCILKQETVSIDYLENIFLFAKYGEYFKLASLLLKNSENRKINSKKCFQSIKPDNDVLNVKCLHQCCDEKGLSNNEHVIAIFEAFKNNDIPTVLEHAFTLMEESPEFSDCWLYCYEPYL